MTDSDAKEWVTIKIPAGTRAEAKKDPRTYGEIMQAGLDSDAQPDGPVPLLDAVGTTDDLREQLDRIEAAATTAEERTGTIERTLEEMGR